MKFSETLPHVVDIATLSRAIFFFVYNFHNLSPFSLTWIPPSELRRGPVLPEIILSNTTLPSKMIVSRIPYNDNSKTSAKITTTLCYMLQYANWCNSIAELEQLERKVAITWWRGSSVGRALHSSNLTFFSLKFHSCLSCVRSLLARLKV